MAVDESDSRRLAVRKLDRQAKAEARAGQSQLVFADGVEEPRPVAQDDGHAGNRVPDHVAKAAQAGERNADLVPVRSQRQVFRGSDGQQALGAGRDDAGVGNVERKAGAGREGLGQGNGSLMQLAGVVGVGVERGHGKGCVPAADANPLPVERGGDLQRDARERRLAVVADGDQARGRRCAARRCAGERPDRER